MTGRAVTDTGPAGAGLLYDTRRGVHYPSPSLRGWLYLPRVWESLVGSAAAGPIRTRRCSATHEVSHVHVCAAAACQFAAIALVIG